ncbi:hypothetical protein PTKIN_Ptkin06aG0053300 [Pterospermum kingtungense]
MGLGSGVGENNEEGSETDYLGESDRGSYECDEDGEVVYKKGTKTYFDPSDTIPNFALGMIFEGPKQFKEALVDLVKKNPKHRSKAFSVLGVSVMLWIII